MKELSQEKVIEKFESLPKEFQDLILSDKLSGFISKMAAENNLKEEKSQLFSVIIEDFIMGLYDENELIKEFKDVFGIQEMTTHKILSTLKTDILSGGTQQEQTKKDFSVQNEAISKPQVELKPSFKESVVTSSSPRAEAALGEIIHPAPFVLHEEKPMEGTQSARQDLSVQRPTFYKPAFGSGGSRFESYAKPRAATVELGSIETKKDLSGSIKTSPQQIRVVHYSEFKTEVNPFGGQPTIPSSPMPTNNKPAPSPVADKIQQTPQPPLTSIHPNNIVDLKDLPLE